jgi:aspartyl protease family protein
MTRRWFPIVLLALAAPALAVAPVEILALFKDRAVIRVGGTEHMLKVGETSPQGVTLLAADAHGARVRFLDEEHALTLSSRVGGSFKPVDRQRVDISPDGFGQYRIRGAIDGHFVNFLVDTGASVVAMSTRHARSLGLDCADQGRSGAVQTAQGSASACFMNLSKVTVGGITGHNVQAAVIDGDHPLEILLGMSFLRQVAMEERAGVLTLTAKF